MGSWGPRQVAIGISWAIFFQIATTAAFIGIIFALGHDFRLQDEGEDVFDRAGFVLEWSDERLKAVAEGAEVPNVPRLAADVFSIKVGFATTFIHQGLLLATVAVMTKQLGVRRLLRTFGMDRFSWDELWAPVVAVIGMYAFVIGWSLAMTAFGPEILRPQSRVPVEIARDPVALAMGGLLACLTAPIAEEAFFRGFLFRGLLRWGAPAAIAVSGFIFSAAHLDLGSLVPFFAVGAVLAWLYWRRGCLWDNIAFHFLFNFTSYMLLVAGAGDV